MKNVFLCLTKMKNAEKIFDIFGTFVTILYSIFAKKEPKGVGNTYFWNMGSKTLIYEKHYRYALE